MKAHYVYKEVTQLEELETLLKLRYKLFRASEVGKFCPSNKYQMDIDKYDLRAKHFGLYKIIEPEQIPIGYQRIIYDHETSTAKSIRNMITNFPLLSEKISSPPDHPFYTMTFSKYDQAISDFYKTAKANGKGVIEAGRFCIDPAECSLGLFRFGVMCPMANLLINEKIGYGITSCFVRLARIYKQFGFEFIPQTDTEIIHKIEACNVFIELKNVSANYQEKLQKMASAFKTHQSISYYPNSPGIYSPLHINNKENTFKNLELAA
jgi:N-acyl-L-homoserine lactone synthetase